MEQHGSFTKWIRLVITAAMAATVGVAINATSPASAVLLEDFPSGPDVPTAFEIDGNKGTDGADEAGTGTAFDWDDALDGTVGPYSFSVGTIDYDSTGVVASAFNTDVLPADCGGTPNEDGFGGGAKIDDNPWAVITTNVNSKSDACSGATALEIMRVTDTVTGDDQLHYILYTYWTRSLDATGDMTVYQIFQGTNPDPLHRCDDLLFEFNYDPSSGIGEIITLEWNGTGGSCSTTGTWAPTGVPAVAAAITGANVDPADVGSGAANDDTFGESAIDLTASGVLPVDECSTFSTAGYITRTGNSQSGSTIDNFAFTNPIVIDTCTDMIISKDANVTGSTAEFAYLLDQLDGQAVHDGSLSATGGGLDSDGTASSITSLIGVGDSHTWSGVVAQPDYQLDETVIPTGWDLVDITCTYYDPFLGGGLQTDAVVSDNTGILDQFIVPPAIADGGQTTTCAITNQTSAVQVVKAGSGDPAADFPFTITDPSGGADVGLQIGGVDSPLSLGETADAVTYTPGTTVTITETSANTAPWSLDSIECDGGTGLTVDTNAGTASFGTVGGETVTCTFTNNQAGQINVVKTGAGAVAGPFEFAPSYGPNFTLSIGDPADNSGALTSSALLPGDYAVSELLAAFNASIAPAPAFVGSATCAITTPGSGTSTFGGSGVDPVVTLGAGDIVTCTFTNVQNGRIIVDKASVNGDDTFSFTGDLSGSITTVNGATASGEELSGDFAAGTYAVAETPTAGYTMTESSCDDDSAPGSIALAAGEVVTCTFTNTRNEGTFTIDKAWGDADPGEVVDLTASTSGPAPLDTAISTTATAPAAAVGDSSMTVYSGQSIRFDETFDEATNADNYTTTLNCNVPVTADPDNRGGTIDVGDTPGDISCTFTNTRKQAGVRLQKVWVDALTGDTADLTASVTGGATDSATSTAPLAPTYGGPTDANDSTAFIAVAAGQTISLSETISAGPNYTTELTCAGATNPVTPGAQNRSGTLVIDALDDGNEIICTFTNTRISVDLTVEKDWTDAVGGDIATIASSGADNDVDFVATAGAAGDSEVDETDTDPTTYQVFAGETLSFSEVIAPGDPDAYTTTFSCNGTDSATDEQLTIDPADGPITCTYDNTRRTARVVVEKSLLPSGDDGSFDLSVNADEATVTGGDGTATTPLTVFVGDQVTIAEAATDSFPALVNYSTTLVCDNGVRTLGTVTGDTTRGDAFTVPSDLSDNEIITCTFENTRQQTPLTVTKSWADSPANNDAVSLAISGGLATPVAGANVNDDPDAGDTDATTTVYAGETITVTEAFTTGSAANYDTTLVCTDGSGDLVPLTESLTGDVVVPSTPTAITCTFTNTRIRGELTLRKQWINAAPGDTAALTIVGEDAAGPARATSTAILGNSVDTINTATMTVYSGETLDLDEAVTPGANYDSRIICTGSDNDPTGSDTSYDLAITPADQDAGILCTFLNTRKQVRVDLVKDWDDSPVNDDAVSLTITNLLPGTNGLDSNDGDDTNDVDATAQALAGETISLTEAFTAGAAENYDTSLECLDAAGASVGTQLTYADGALTGDLVVDPADAGTTVTCTFTNVRKSTTLNLAKTWVGSVLADEAHLSIAGTASDLDVLATAPGGDGAAPEAPASTTVYAGETVTLNETVDPNGTNTANYNSSDFACSAGTEAPVPWAAGDTSVDLLVSAADVSAPIDCSFENTAERGTIIIAKSVDGVNDGTFQFAGDWSADGTTITPATVTDPTGFAITTSGLTGSVLFEDVLVPKDGAVPYSVTETDPTPAFDGTKVTCSEGVNGDGGSGPIDGSTLPLTGSIDLDEGEIVTCTFTNTERSTIIIVKDVRTFDGGPLESDQSFIFTADYSVDPIVLNDDGGVDAVPNSDTSALLNAENGATYTVTEAAEFGWTLNTTLSSCTNGDLFDGDGVTITPDPGDTVTCTFVNTANPAGLTATKTVEGQTGPWGPFTFTLSGGPVAAGETNSQPVDSVDPVASWTELVEGTTYTLAETGPVPGYQLGTFTCLVATVGTPAPLDDADPGTDGFQFVAVAGAQYGCAITNTALPGSVSLVKTVEGVDGDFDWDAFEFTIAPAAAPSATQTVDDAGSGDFGPITWTGLVAGSTYTIAETPPTGFIAGDLECTVTHADVDVAPTTSTDTFVVTPGASVACTITNTADTTEVQITKTVDGGLDAGVAWEFDFTIDPLPNGQVNPLTAGDSGSTSDTVLWGNLVPGTTYTVTEVVPDTNSTEYEPGTLTCSDAAGALQDLDLNDQSFTFVAPLAAAGIDISCEITNTAQSDVTFDKVVDSVIRDAGSGVWTITYLIDVVNADDAGAGVYDLYDEFAFGGGVTIVDGTAAAVNTVPGTIDTQGDQPTDDFDGVGNTAIVQFQTIEAATTHTYQVSVDVMVAVGPDTDGDCITTPGEGSGFLNTMLIVVDGGEPQETDACAGFAQLTLVKDLINDDGGNATLADFPLTATGPATLSGVSGTDAVSSAVPAGEYALGEQELVDGYINLGWACTGAATSTSSSVSLVDGENATCTIINDDESVDLELTKNDDGVTVIAGGAPFEYTITVQNIGDRDIDLDEPVTVTDELPDGLSWVSFPDNCSQAGQTLTCDIDPVLLPAGGAPIVITATVSADADAASGIYVNKASVTTEDDTTTNPPCPAVDDNNVDCEETPVGREGAIQIIKTDDVADGAAVEPGGAYGYQLVVTNTGVSTILPGLVVSDDLPAGLGLVSVTGGAGWSCNSTDPIECTYAPALAPGASAPSISIDVEVSQSAAVDEIVNVAEVIGAVDRDCVSERLVEAFDPACNEVTDDDDETTPLNPNADLAIVKTASVDQVGAGSGFDWILDVTNNGPGTAINVEIGDIVPDAVTVTKVTSSDFDCGSRGNTVTCTVGSLAVGESGSVRIAVSVPLSADGGVVDNVGTVESDTPDPDLTNNSDDASVVIVAQAAPTTTLPPVTLPPTGSNSTSGLVQSAFLLLLLGGVTVLIARRRNEEANSAG